MVIVLSLISAGRVSAQDVPDELRELQNIESGAEELTQDELAIRRDALRDAALSFGARGGLAFRTREINERLSRQEPRLSRTYDFRQLLIPAPSGLLIEPPVISEADNALIIGEGGQSAATIERVLEINQQVRLVTAPRDWRSYLIREVREPEAPPGLLLPQDSTERAQWKRWVAQGWEMGLRQADEIFEVNLARLVNDFTGMVRYRRLLAQGMVSPPYALMTDRGITGGGDELRIGDRAVSITGQPRLDPEGGRWRPADR